MFGAGGTDFRRAALNQAGISRRHQNEKRPPWVAAFFRVGKILT
jgi:hypothetical protein